MGPASCASACPNVRSASRGCTSGVCCEQGLRSEPTRLEGQYAGPLEPTQPAPSRPAVVFAGRHIPEKRAPALVPALALARQQIPDLRGEIYGDGPERARVLREIDDLGLDGAGLGARIRRRRRARAGPRERALPRPALTSARATVSSSSRPQRAECPSSSSRAPTTPRPNWSRRASTGRSRASAAPGDLADAIRRVASGGEALRESTHSWFLSNAARLSLDSSLAIVASAYEDEASARS